MSKIIFFSLKATRRMKFLNWYLLKFSHLTQNFQNPESKAINVGPKDTEIQNFSRSCQHKRNQNVSLKPFLILNCFVYFWLSMCFQRFMSVHLKKQRLFANPHYQEKYLKQPRPHTFFFLLHEPFTVNSAQNCISKHFFCIRRYKFHVYV